MTNLLSANLFRMKKNHLFRGCLLISAAAGAWQSIQTFLEHGRTVPLDSIFFVYAMLIGLLLSVFLPLFFGSEYSDGAIRNKLAAGHTRLAVYLSNLTAAVSTAVLFCGACILCTMAAGVPLLGGPKYPGLLLKTTLLSLLMAAAWCALYTAVIMNCSRKAASAVSCMLLYLLLFMVATWVFAKLDAPEFWPSYELIDGEMVSEMVRNPAYLLPEARRVYEFWLDLNPMGQSIQYIDVSPARPLQLALCSVGVFAAATAAGLALFQRKDLK
jgi:ABC-type transport system involved in multi-copper enzyme maturation permease subunit